MLKDIITKFDGLERRLRHSFGKDISGRRARALSLIHYYLLDHAFLRTFWTNFFRIGPDVYRSNQPTHRRLRKYKAMGMKTVINLRGDDVFAHYLFEKESCDKLGLNLINVRMQARGANTRDSILEAINTLRTAPRPLMFHCKSGADRAGFVAATYKLVFEGATVDQAREMLSLKYIHLKNTKTGVQDYVLDVYEARLAQGQIGFEDWIATEYDPAVIQSGFNDRADPAPIAQRLMGQR